MPQGPLPFEYRAEDSCSRLTALGGLPLYLDLAAVLDLSRTILRYVRVRAGEGRGYDDVQMIMSVILLNLCGGDCVDDLNRLEGDRGFGEILRHVELGGMSRQERRALQRRWRKTRERVVPSPSAMFRYLRQFHDPAQEEERARSDVKAFIPKPNENLLALRYVNRDLVRNVARRAGAETTATLDLDATVIEAYKQAALYSYLKHKAYQPLNVWWAETRQMLHTEFRDGNVPAAYDNLRVFQEALELLPKTVTKASLRSDAAGYQVDLMRYCAQAQHPRFGRIEFAISVPVDKTFKRDAAEVERLAEQEACPEGQPKPTGWHPVYQVEGKKLVESKQEWAVICHEPDWQTKSATQRIDVRFIAIREPLEQQSLPGMEEALETVTEKPLPFQTMTLGSRRYKLFGLVSNRKGDPEAIIQWHRERSGKAEEAHAALKTDLAGGQMPSALFGANAAWWWMSVIAMNLNTAMKQLVLASLSEHWVTKRMKAIRFHILNVAARVVHHARRLIVSLARDHPALGLFLEARARIQELATL